MCAIKAVSKKDVLNQDSASITFLEREILALGDDCRFLTALYAAFQTKERLFFVMEFVSGGDLFHHIFKVWVQFWYGKLSIFLCSVQKIWWEKVCFLRNRACSRASVPPWEGNSLIQILHSISRVTSTVTSNRKTWCLPWKVTQSLQTLACAKRSVPIQMK